MSNLIGSITIPFFRSERCKSVQNWTLKRKRICPKCNGLHGWHHRKPTRETMPMMFRIRKGGKPQLSLQISQRIIQLDQVRVEAVEPGAPISNRLFRGEPQDRKIAGRGTILSQAGKVVAKKRDGALANHSFAFIHGKHSSQHPLVFSVWLAKVEVWHTCASSAESRGTLIVRRSFYVGKSCLPATPPRLQPHFLPYFRLILFIFSVPGLPN